MKAEHRKFSVLGIILLISLIIDQWTKQLVHTKFYWGESKTIIPGFFNLTYVRNKGAAFGFLHSAPESFREPFFLIVPFVMIGVICLVFWRLKPNQKLSQFSLSLILSGAIGNLIDRLRFGYVVDFLDFYLDAWGHYPAFNVADSCIVVGVIILSFQSFFSKESPF